MPDNGTVDIIAVNSDPGVSAVGVPLSSSTAASAPSKTFLERFVGDCGSKLKFHTRAAPFELCAVLGFIAATILAGCSGGSPGTPPPVPPTVVLSAKETSILIGSSISLTWSSTHASTCTASGSWTGAQDTKGNIELTPSQTGAETFTLTCRGAGTASTAKSVTVNIILPPVYATMPMIPAELPLGSGIGCAPFSDSIVTAKCITAATQISVSHPAVQSPEGFEVSAGSASELGLNPGATTSGGTCSAALSSSSQLSLNTTFGNYAASLTDSVAEEFSYSAAQLAIMNSANVTYTQGSAANVTYTQVSALIFTNKSNSQQFSGVMQLTTSLGPVTIYFGGQNNGYFNDGVTADVCLSSSAIAVAALTPPSLTIGSYLIGVTVTSSSVPLWWFPSPDIGGPGIAGYYIYRSDQGNVPIATVPPYPPANTESPEESLTYTDNTVSAGTTYTYSIVAFDSFTPTPDVSAPATATVTTPAGP
jgi:hypothetical protein